VPPWVELPYAPIPTPVSAPSEQVIVTVDPTLLAPDSSLGETVLIVNRDPSTSIFLGPAGVSSSTGFEVKAGTSPGPLLVPVQSDMWAAAAAGSVRVDVLRLGAA
jgi:hypothetical protein